MRTWLAPIRLIGRVGYLLLSWILVALVFVQVFFAGIAVLVELGNWNAHVNLGRLFSLPIMAMAILSLVGWMGVRFFLTSLLLWVLYAMQYVFLHLPSDLGGPAILAAFHPVNALVIGFTGYTAARGAWRLVVEAWPGAGAGLKRPE